MERASRTRFEYIRIQYISVVNYGDDYNFTEDLLGSVFEEHGEEGRFLRDGYDIPFAMHGIL